MEVKTVKKFLLACHAANRILNMLPDLPEGIGPRDLRILETVDDLAGERGKVRVSDVSERLGVSRPGVTRDISRLEAEGYLRKEQSPDDGRIVFVSLADSGERVRQKYATRYHEHLAEVLADFDDAQLEQAADTVSAVARAMASRPVSSAGEVTRP